MRIEPAPPFRLIPEPGGLRHAIQDQIQVSVLPDVDCEFRHRNGLHKGLGPNGADGHTRWLIVELEGGITLYVHGTHVVVTRQELLPT